MAFILKVEKKSIVPWFSMSEWDEVYHQLFSEDSAVQRKGYERLLVWKARCQTLPAGVECTLILIHVCLQDQEIWPQIVSGTLPPYREHDLRLNYSTAIMRFLNHLSFVITDGKETLYKVAKKLNIPDWVVNIRHDVAHGLSMPPLTLLREAVHFTLGWIHEHYWKGEADLTRNYVDDKEVDNTLLTKQLRDYLELWQAVKLYCQAGYVEVKSIPDSDLKLKLNRMLENIPKKGHKIVNNGSSVDIIGNWRSTEVLDQLVHLLRTALKKNAECNADELLVMVLLEGEAFLPGEQLLSMMSTGNDDPEGSQVTLPIRLLQLWQDLLTSLQTVNLLPILIKKLIDFSGRREESFHRRQMAAIWVKEICEGFLKVRRIHKFIITYRTKKEKKRKSEKQINNNLLNEFDKKYPQYKNVLALRLTRVPDIDLALVKETMHAPTKWSNIFVPSLLDLVEPALPQSTKDNLLSVLKIYTSEVVPIFDSESERIEAPVYSLDSLGTNIKRVAGSEPIIIEVGCEDEENVYMNTAQNYSDGWSRSEAYLEWENCPLGVLPWQRNVPVVALDMPKETIWTPVQPLVAFKEASKNFPGTFQKNVVRDELHITKKRTKKMKRASGSNFVKKAFKTVIGI